MDGFTRRRGWQERGHLMRSHVGRGPTLQLRLISVRCLLSFKSVWFHPQWLSPLFTLNSIFQYYRSSPRLHTVTSVCPSICCFQHLHQANLPFILEYINGNFGIDGEIYIHKPFQILLDTESRASECAIYNNIISAIESNKDPLWHRRGKVPLPEKRTVLRQINWQVAAIYWLLVLSDLNRLSSGNYF